MRTLIENIKENSPKLLELKPKQKEQIILEIASNLRKNLDFILKENAKDLLVFDKSEAFRDRLLLNEKRLEGLCEGLECIARLDEPIGKVLGGFVNHAGLKIEKVSIPIGLLCVIYEARPALSAEITALMLKSSNACIFKGGSEATNSSKAFYKLVLEVLEKYDLQKCYLMLESKDEINELLKFDDLIDALIPRGSTQMIKEVAQNTKIPLIRQDKGLCHIFADESANLKQAVSIIINAKCQRPSVCNALESLLVHEKIASELFTLLKPELAKFKVKIHAHQNAFDFFKDYESVVLADEKDFENEYLALELNVKIVKDINEAIKHIHKFSSAHSESILSNDHAHIEKFQKMINSACVYANASTRFSDGGEFGFGGEVGISTSKLHARGPMGVNEITTYKYLISGDGQIRK
ncbi:glutamate-5-semialdehyde dehydrogenase [Campylobacter sp. MIT 99-7217]|uniref:glutamate-5-semialdehyde dehydrogenase n=1 Tax=Campylobacter sp. MIT 99-7217 TaxID=535091 RepID=UPI0011583ADD|nr:glutamate-5-semialdehyde dehydrogenase [Campylobacter sp. MIT 99-7217]TQR34478.1 glutamate-5-semialdehyde dehydrogenase [Campylobacter sp. MIT 99-7217]